MSDIPLDYTLCGNCDKTDGYIYPTYPPKVKCALTGEFHFIYESCYYLDKVNQDNAIQEKENNNMSKQNNEKPIEKKKMLVVNLFGSPGSGKSTGCAYIFAKLKMLGYNAEMAPEYVKDKVWEETVEVFKNQAYIFGKQYFRISRVKDKVDVVITDSPILLSMFYNNQPELGENFCNMCMDVFNSFDNFNVFLTRAKPYNPAGRFQTEEESDALVQPMIDMLDKYNVRYATFPGTEDGYNAIVERIVKILDSKT